MHLKVIKNDAEHELALEILLRLMEQNPEPGSAEEDTLEVLSILIEQYEVGNFPVDLPTPIDAIKFRMEQQGLTQKDMRPYFGSASKTSEVLNGKRALSLAMIRKLHTGLGIPAEVLIQKEGATLPDSGDVIWTDFPLAEMKKKGCFPEFTGSLAELKEYAEEYISQFLKTVRSTYMQPALCRTSAHYVSDKQVDNYALLAWQIKVLQKAERVKTTSPYVPGSISLEVMQELAKQSWTEQGPKVAQEFLSLYGVKLVIEPHFDKTYLDGATMLDAEGAPVIGLTLRHDRLDNFWFTLLHELAHVSEHLDAQEERIFFDDLDSPEKDQIEHEADTLASKALIPPKTWSRAEVRKTQSEEDCISLAKELRIHPAIVAGRIRHESQSYDILTNVIGSKMVRCHFS